MQGELIGRAQETQRDGGFYRDTVDGICCAGPAEQMSFVNSISVGSSKMKI